MMQLIPTTFGDIRRFGVRALTVAGMALLLAACAATPTRTFKVDALTDPDRIPTAPPGESIAFYIEPAYDLEEGETLRFREAAGYVETALAGAGYYRTRDRSRARVLIRMDAAISDPVSESRVYSEPIYVRRWGYSRTVRVPVRNEEGKVVSYRYSTIYEPPRTEFAGWTDRMRRTTVYEKALDLTAYEMRNGERGPEQWTLRVSSVDESSDLRSYLPLLVAAAMPYVGERTPGEVQVRMRDDHENVKLVRRGI
ncbi:MAG: hypothetical protein JJU00_04305 [Opitutales bacterium]|nr:hypothetical protein [Opitutales bacterium]